MIGRTLESDATSGQTGLLQSLDPRVKLVSFVGLLIVGALAHRLLTLGVLIVFCLVLALVSRIGIQRLAVRAWIFIPLFTAVISLPETTSWVSPGHAVLTIWRDQHLSFGPFTLPSTLALTTPGLLSAAHLILRVTVVVSLTVLLTLSTRWNDLLKSLRVLRAPKMFVFILAMAYRYIHLLARILSETLLARRSRMVGRPTTKQNRRFVGTTAGALFGKSQALGEQVYGAMRARGYEGEMRTLADWRLRRRDYVWSLSLAAVFALTLFLGLSAGRGI